MDQPDSLEDWVAIKNAPFYDDKTSSVKLNFHIAWNEIEGKIAITARDRNRTVQSDASYIYTGVFTFNEIRAAHEQLCLIYPSLGPYLPEMPEEPQGLWAYIYTQAAPNNEICELIETYLNIVLQTCGSQLLISTFFEEHSYEEYFENISELKKKKFEESIYNAEEELKNALFLREGAINLLDMLEVYKHEDAAMLKLNIALAELYNYELQPFLDIREVSKSHLREAKGQIDNTELGEKRKEDYRRALKDWQEHYANALDNIQDVYLKYYKITVRNIKEMRERILEDKKQFGKTAFELDAQERLNRINEDFCLEKLQLLQMKHQKAQQELDKVKQEIVSVEESAQASTILDDLEQKAYHCQAKLFDVKLNILSEQENVDKQKLEVRKREIKVAAEVEEFYDAVEDTEELSSDDEGPIKKKSNDPKVVEYQSSLSALYKRRAKLRNKRDYLIRSKHLEVKLKQDEIITFDKHHAIQKKRDESKEKKATKKSFIDEERKKALERLKKYKMKYPTPKTIKPSRYQPPNKKGGVTYDKKENVKAPVAFTIPSDAKPKGSPAKYKGSPIRKKGKDSHQQKVKDNVDGSAENYSNSSVLPEPLSVVPEPPVAPPSGPPPPPLPKIPPPPPPLPKNNPPPPPVGPLPPFPSNNRPPSQQTAVSQNNPMENLDAQIKAIQLKSRSNGPGSSTDVGNTDTGINKDEILAARKKLGQNTAHRKIIQKPQEPELLQLIRNGVLLRKTPTETTTRRPRTYSNEHEKTLMATLTRINKANRDESDDESEIDDDNWA